jgi:hypothetical protein
MIYLENHIIQTTVPLKWPADPINQRKIWADFGFAGLTTTFGRNKPWEARGSG